MLALCLSLGAETLKTLSYEGGPGVGSLELAGMGLSPNGRFVCGMIGYGEGFFAMDLESGVCNYKFELDSELHNIDNNGLAIGYLGDMGVTYSWNGEMAELNAIDASCKYTMGEDLTNDGSVRVGTSVEYGYVTHAAISVNGGEWTRLPEPPADQLGKYTDGSMAIGISGDGKYIIGHADNFGPIIMWTRNDDGSYEPDALFSRYCALDESEKDIKPLLDLHAQAISNNGLYVLCLASKSVVDGNGDEIKLNFPAVYNTDTREFKFYDELQNIDEKNLGLAGTAIADDGSFVGIIGSMMNANVGCFVMKAGETQAKLFVDAFPQYAEKFEVADKIGNSIPTDVSADGRYILGFAYYSEDLYDPTLHVSALTYIIDNGVTDSAVGSVSMLPVSEEIYSLDGVRLTELKKGVNIIRMSDGSVRKVIKK